MHFLCFVIDHQTRLSTQCSDLTKRLRSFHGPQQKPFKSACLFRSFCPVHIGVHTSTHPYMVVYKCTSNFRWKWSESTTCGHSIILFTLLAGSHFLCTASIAVNEIAGDLVSCCIALTRHNVRVVRYRVLVPYPVGIHVPSSVPTGHHFGDGHELPHGYGSFHGPHSSRWYDICICIYCLNQGHCPCNNILCSLPVLVPSSLCSAVDYTFYNLQLSGCVQLSIQIIVIGSCLEPLLDVWWRRTVEPSLPHRRSPV
jgi:hypothetical protein